jgi:glutamate-1-semialdehyde 2,1-aminomutase
MQNSDVPAHLERVGQRAMDGWTELASSHGVPARAGGLPQFAHLEFDHANNLELGTLFTVRMLERGYLASSSFYPTLAHTPKHVDDFIAASSKVFNELREAIARGDILERLHTPVRHTGFQRLT